jgi:phosphoribosyl 1,2-cyclic phosphodiesterase
VNAISLQSGSNGNCVYIETDGIKILIDAGISSVRAADRLKMFGRDIKDVDVLIISHDHGDHSRHAGVYQRKFGLPIYITPKTFQRASAKYNLGKLSNVNYFQAGDELKFGTVSIQTVPSPHDGVDGAVFNITSGEKRLGVWTDLGHVFNDLYSEIPLLDAVFLESNYDPLMLARGPYPDFLKRRIQGPSGHISNAEAAELLLAGTRLKWACLAHLSNNNNDPATALKTHRKIGENNLTLYTASRYEATGTLTV